MESPKTATLNSMLNNEWRRLQEESKTFAGISRRNTDGRVPSKLNDVDRENQSLQKKLDEANQAIKDKDQNIKTMAWSLRCINQKLEESLCELVNVQKEKDDLLEVVQERDGKRDRVKNALDKLQTVLIEREENTCKVMNLLQQQNEILRREVVVLRGERNSVQRQHT